MGRGINGIRVTKGRRAVIRTIYQIAGRFCKEGEDDSSAEGEGGERG